MSELSAEKIMAFKHTNSISELLNILSERLWADDSIKDRFALAALVDGARSAGNELHDLIESRME